MSNAKFKLGLFIVSIIVLAFLIHNTFILAGEENFRIVNTMVSPFAALIAAFLFFRARALLTDHRFRSLWFGLAMGFGLWGLADALWAFYPLLTQQDLPDASIADLIWIIGYIPLYYAIIVRLRTLEARPSRTQIRNIAIISVGWCVIAIVYGVMPILGGTAPEDWLVGLIALTYVFGDLGLVILACIILLLLKGGRYGWSWHLIIAGIFIMAISDIMYTYASWQGLYYPDGHVNFLTNLGDTTYTLSYFFVGFGVFLYICLWEMKETIEIYLVTRTSNRYSAFVATNRENRVISASDNLFCLVNAPADCDYYKMPLNQALGINSSTLQMLIEKLAQQGIISNEMIIVNTLDRKTRDVDFSATAFYDPDHGFNGANVVVRADLLVADELRTPKNPELLDMMNYLLAQADAPIKADDQIIRDYFVDTLKVLASILIQFGGGNYISTLFDDLRDTTHKMHLPIEINEQVFTVSEDCHGKALAGMLLILIQSAHQSVARMTGEQIVKEKLYQHGRHVAEDRADLLDRYHLRSELSVDVE